MDPQGEGARSMPNRRRTHVPAAASALGRVAEALDGFCAAERLPDDTTWRLRVAVDEIVANIVAYGAAGGAIPTIDVAFRRNRDGVEVVVADDGPAFDPLARPDPDITLPLESRQPGGLGIALVKSLMDDVRYERTTRNVLTMWTQIGGGSGGSHEHPAEHS